MFHDVSIFFMLHNMDEVCYNQIGTYASEAKRAEGKIHCKLFDHVVVKT